MRLVQLFACGVLVLALLLLWPTAGSVRRTVAGDSVATQMSGPAAAGFRRAEQVRAFEFPRDHGPHPGYRTEWWYLTGSVQTTGGRRFGLQWTLFRSELHPHPTDGLSGQAWDADAAYMLHVGLTDVQGRRFLHAERFARGSGGLAGAQAEPQPRAWMDDDQLQRQADGSWLLTGRAEGGRFFLQLQPRRAPVLNGVDGLSQKGAGAGNASYYYSWPFLAASGTVTIADEAHAVSGELWLDREWSTSALDPDQAGWDWLALHLPDGRSLMTYRLRDHAQQAGPQSQGTISWPDGRRRHLTAGDFVMQPVEWWRSPHTGRRWPVAWRVQVPGADGQDGIELDVRALLPDQEHQGRFGYWEGLVEARSPMGELAYGYLELVGYGP